MSHNQSKSEHPTHYRPQQKNRPINKEKSQIDDTHYSITIVNPGNDAIIPLGPGNFSVNLTVPPDLTEEHSIQLLLDGKTHGSAQKSLTFSLTNIYRGSHQIVVNIVNSKNETIEQSDAIVVHVFRPRKRR